MDTHMETHCDYKIRWILEKEKSNIVSVVFTTGHYEEIEGEEVYVRSGRFWGDTNEFRPAKTHDEFIIFYNDKLKKWADKKGLVSIPEQVEV